MLFAQHSKQFPVHALHLITEQLTTTKKSIDLALLMFSTQRLTNALTKRLRKSLFSEVLDLLGLTLPDHRHTIENGNQPLKTQLQTLGTPKLAHDNKLHNKFASISSKTDITAFLTDLRRQPTPTTKCC
ncbi:hypothetical protein [Synechococcus sp. UW179A]|uniref:hypothetical protein n=1 Tax=Synechococcus sp. UW179A TaxID=2575510 RepID=UPI000E0EF820|nr:hypothetical protein [Synechococcus sp. UW179A]